MVIQLGLLEKLIYLWYSQYCYHVDTVASAQEAENKSLLEFPMRQITHNFQVLSDWGYFIETKIKPLNSTKVCDGLAF